MSANDSEPAKRSARRTPKKQAGKQAGDRQKPATEPRAREGEAVVLPEDKRDQVWTLHLRGMSKRQIASQLDLHRDTVTRLISECYREFGAERRARLKRKLDAAVAHLRQVQRQAWADHDADDARERAVLEAATPGTRYQSQRSQYLRVALDAEKEIARLEGLYADDAPDVLGALFRIERVERSERPARVVSGDVDDGSGE